MSGSSSTVHIGQDPASTYQADGRFTPKTDDGATVVVGDLDTNIGAEWGNTVDDQFWKVNEIFQADDFADALALGAAQIGSNTLSVTGTAETTGNVTVGGDLIVSGGTALPTLDVSSPSSRPGVAAFGGRVDVFGDLHLANRIGVSGADPANAYSQADDGVFGFIGSGNNGITVGAAAAGHGWMVFSKAANVPFGGLHQDFNTNRLYLRNNNTDYWVLGGTGDLSPVADNQYSLGAPSLGVVELWMTDGTNHPRLLAGSGSPEGSITADVGSVYMRTDGGASTSIYIKESGTGNTGWVAK